MEDVLAVPKRLTQTAHDLLVKTNGVPRPYHLEGRFGWRTHLLQDDEKGRMGIPIIRGILLKTAEDHADLKTFLDQVEILSKPYYQSFRARQPPDVDARIHPERQITYTATLPVEDSSKSLFTYAELFAGIGGFGVALDALGGKCVFCSELEEHCRATYQLNFDTDPANIHGDIYKVPNEALPIELDLLVGGFPCQPFSALGKQPGFECENGWGNLFLEIVRVLEHSKPKAFLCENVPGLLTMTETFDTILAAFQKCGYTVTYEVCAARGLTATGRKRLFFAGLRNNPEGSDKFEFPFVPDLSLRAENCLDYDDLPQEELDVLRLAEPTFWQLISGRRWKPASLAWPNLVLDTLTSHYGNAVGRGESQLVPCHAPHRPRRFSVRECARLMGFPNSYKFAKQRENQGDMAYRKEGFRMVGNAVCPPLIAALAAALLEHCELKAQGTNWIQKGHDVAVHLAKAATRETRAPLPVGCLVPEEGIPPKKKSKRN
jgi:DNA (cytosine-5)-methyltransferase 1